MKKTIFVCDKCGQLADKLETLYIPYDTSVYGIISHAFELCKDCAKVYVRTTTSFLSDEMRKAVKME